LTYLVFWAIFYPILRGKVEVLTGGESPRVFEVNDLADRTGGTPVPTVKVRMEEGSSKWQMET